MVRRRQALTVAVVISAIALSACSVSFVGPSITTTAPGGFSEQIPVTLSKPDGPGPFPAVVIMHDCSGLGPRSSGPPQRWAKELLGRGSVVLIPDSCTTRGHPDGVCTNPSPSREDVRPARRVRDAYAALAQLRTLPYVDGSHVGLMGGSHGGSTTLGSMIAPDSDTEPLAPEKRAGFAAAGAVYPGWVPAPRHGTAGASVVYRPLAPLLILI